MKRGSQQRGPSKAMKILSLFLRHGTEKYKDASTTLSEYYLRRLPGVTITRVIIDSATPVETESVLDDGTLVIGGDNSLWEFSAWDTGLARFASTLARYDYVHFVTSAYLQLYTAYIDRIDSSMLQALQGKDIALGHIDAYNEPVEFLGVTSQAWIRSSFLFIPPFALRRLGAVTTLGDRAAWFSGDIENPFAQRAAIGPDMRRNIVSWLTGDGTGQGTTWHSRFVLKRETMPFFEAKTLAILNEHALSLRLLAQGTSLVDPTWMSAVLQKKPLVDARALIDWRRQLAQRAPYL